MHHDTFNADYYVVVATVIPLLYLTLTLQGPTYEDLLRKSQALHQGHNAETWTQFLFRMSKWLVVYMAAYIILAAGFGGEAYAVFALYTQSSGAAFQLITFFSFIALLVFVVARPMWRWFVANERLRESNSDEGKPEQDETSSAAAQPADD